MIILYMTRNINSMTLFITVSLMRYHRLFILAREYMYRSQRTVNIIVQTRIFKVIVGSTWGSTI